MIRDSAAASARHGLAGSAENSPACIARRLATASPSERDEDLAGLRLAKAPARPGPGIEQDRDDREIDPGPRRLGRVGAGRDQRRAIDPAGREMPPAAVIGHVEIGIAPSRDVDDAADRLLQPRQNEPKMPGLATLGSGKDDAAALAHGRRGQQFRRLRQSSRHGP